MQWTPYGKAEVRNLLFAGNSTEDIVVFCSVSAESNTLGAAMKWTVTTATNSNRDTFAAQIMLFVESLEVKRGFLHPPSTATCMVLLVYEIYKEKQSPVFRCILGVVELCGCLSIRTSTCTYVESAQPEFYASGWARSTLSRTASLKCRGLPTSNTTTIPSPASKNTGASVSPAAGQARHGDLLHCPGSAGVLFPGLYTDTRREYLHSRQEGHRRARTDRFTQNLAWEELETYGGFNLASTTARRRSDRWYSYTHLT